MSLSRTANPQVWPTAPRRDALLPPPMPRPPSPPSSATPVPTPFVMVAPLGEQVARESGVTRIDPIERRARIGTILAVGAARLPATPPRQRSSVLAVVLWVVVPLVVVATAVMGVQAKRGTAPAAPSTAPEAASAIAAVAATPTAVTAPPVAAGAPAPGAATAGGSSSVAAKPGAGLRTFAPPPRAEKHRRHVRVAPHVPVAVNR